MRTAPCSILTAIVLLVLVHSPKAFAGPPYITDDPEPVEYQHWEVYFASIFSQAAGRLDKHSSPRRSELRGGTERSAPHDRSAQPLRAKQGSFGLRIRRYRAGDQVPFRSGERLATTDWNFSAIGSAN